MKLPLRVRATLIDLICRIVAGGGLKRGERADVEQRLRLFGFRKTAREFLLRRYARAAMEQGGLTLLAPALDGEFVVALAGNDLGVGWEILRDGTYEPHIVAFYRRHLRAGMTVVDVGANIGFHALHAAGLVGPGGRVIAIEPDGSNVRLMRLSLSLATGNPPVEVLQEALSDSDGTVVLSDLGNAENSGARFTHPDRSRLEAHVHGLYPRFEVVPAFRWDSRYADRAIDLVKLDIEGSEPRALAGMEESLARHRPVVVSEFAPSNLLEIGEVEPLEYLAWFEARGYHASVIAEPAGNLEALSAADILARSRRKGHVDLAFYHHEG